MKTSLKNRIIRYFQNHPNVWINKGTICDLARPYGYIGETTGRRLRELENEGILDVRDGKGCREYKYLTSTVTPHTGQPRKPQGVLKPEQQVLYPNIQEIPNPNQSMPKLFLIN